MKVLAFLRLARMHKPIGTLLLWWPVAWALWIAYHGMPAVPILLYFALGVFLMRSAGCVFNDIVDRHIDLQVARTKTRPLACGELNLTQAFLWLVVLLSLALWVLLQLPPLCFYYALCALLLVMIYPFCKRFLSGPQVVLSLAFSVGIPMAYAAANHPVDGAMWGLLCMNGLWVFAYDTIYACMDEADDRRIGIYATTMLFGVYKREVIAGIYLLMHGLWLYLAYKISLSYFFYLPWGVGAFNLCRQVCCLYLSKPPAYLKAFQLNQWYGLWIFLGIVLGLQS